jgi:hypothetical protein
MIQVRSAMSLGLVQDILQSQPEYLNCLPADYERRVIYPSLVTKKLAFLCKYRAFMTWFSPDYPPDGIPDGREFTEKGPLVWIVDVVARPGIGAMELGREVSETLYLHAGVKDGGRVLFWRWPRGRVGHICARKPRRMQ